MDTIEMSMSTLTLRPVNNPQVEYRARDGEPVPYMITIERRILTPDGDEYPDGWSGWEVVTIDEVARQLLLEGSAVYARISRPDVGDRT